jgi:hypothetical protein
MRKITMRKILVISTFIISCKFSFAQVEIKEDTLNVQKNDTIKKRYGKSKEIEIIKVDDKVIQINIDPVDSVTTKKEKFKTENHPHWAGFMMGMNILTTETQGYTFPTAKYWEIDPAKSFSYSINFAERKLNLYKNHIGITTGLGFTFNNYSFKQNFILSSTQDTLFAVSDPSNKYTKNKLKSTYFRVPLLLEFCRSEFDNGFYFSAGVIGGVRLSSKTKRTEKDLAGNIFKEKIKDDYNLNTFSLDALVKFGFDDFGVFAQYSLTPMFKENKTQTIYPFNFGVSFEF